MTLRNIIAVTAIIALLVAGFAMSSGALRIDWLSYYLGLGFGVAIASIFWLGVFRSAR